MDLLANFILFWVILLTSIGTLVLCQAVPFQTSAPFTQNRWFPNQNNLPVPFQTQSPFTENRWSPNQSNLPGQQFSNGFSKPSSASNKVQVQDEELRVFAEDLLQRDYNNLARYTTINYQGKTTSRSQADEAPYPLLQIHRDAYNVPTVNKLLQLLDNYVADVTIAEDVTHQERQEENTFLDKILETEVMQFTKNFLMQKGRISNAPQEFRTILKDVWFSMYPRGGRKAGSSGFEHVFLGELKNSEISGLHNWIYYSIAEANRALNYLGYMKRIDLGNKGSVLKHHFILNNADKPITSMFIGTSPELEIALYTTCFLLRPDQVCPVRMGGNNFIIRTYTYRYNGKALIGSAFAEI